MGKTSHVKNLLKRFAFNIRFEASIFQSLLVPNRAKYPFKKETQKP